MIDSPSPLFLTSQELKFKVLANDHSKVRKPITHFKCNWNRHTLYVQATATDIMRTTTTFVYTSLKTKIAYAYKHNHYADLIMLQSMLDVLQNYTPDVHFSS